MYTRYFLTEQFDRSRPVFYIYYERTNERTNDSKRKIIILLLAILSSIGIIIIG